MKQTFDKMELDGFYRYCVALTGDEQAAWDLLQNGLEKWTRLDHAKVRRPRSYFKSMLRNRFIDDRRRLQQHAEEPFDEDQAVVQINTRSLEDIVATRQEVRDIMANLNPDEREMLFLWAVEGYSIRDIADYLTTPRGTILSRLHRLRARIQSRVKKMRFSHGKKLQRSNR